VRILELEERRNRYIGDDLYNASRADMFLPTKTKNQKKRYSVVCDSCFEAGEGRVRVG